MDPVQPNIIQPEPQTSSLNRILTISLVILTILTIGFGVFIFLKMNNKLTLPEKTSTITPTAIVTGAQISPTESVTDTDNPSDINIGSVEADLNDIGTDVGNLQ